MTNIFVGFTTMISGGAIGTALLLRSSNISGDHVRIVYGTYTVPHGTVHYRACIPQNSKRGKPILRCFSPGLTIQFQNWMPHCTLLAERNYVAMMIDRPGSKYDEWLTEVEEGIELLKSIPFTDDDRVDAMGSSFGFQSISYYALRHPNEIQGYINDSGITTRGSCDSLANVDTPALVLSGGGEYQENVKTAIGTDFPGRRRLPKT